MNKTTTIIIMMMVFTLVTVSAVTYYISPTGNDGTGSGNITHPWRTLGTPIYGAKQVAAGSIIIMAQGDYPQAANALNSIYTDRNYDIRCAQKYSCYLRCTDCTSQVLFMGGSGVVSITNLSINNTNAGTKCLQVRGSNGQVYLKNLQAVGCADAVQISNTGGTISNGWINDSNLHTNRTGGKIFNFATGTTHVRIKNNTMSGIIDINITADTIFSNNHITGNTEIKSSTANYLNRTNLVNVTRLYFNGVRIPKQYFFTIENITFKYYKTKAEHVKIIRLYNTTNIIINNVTMGNTTKPLTPYSQAYTMYGISVETGSVNITVNNSNFYTNKSVGAIVGTSAYEAYMTRNINITNNKVYAYNNNTYGINFEYCVKNILFQNNYLWTNNMSVAHLLGVGAESRTPVNPCWRMMTQLKVINNTAIAPNNDAYGVIHTIFVGYGNNITVSDNYVYGGAYNYVIKNNHGGYVKNNIGRNASFFGILHKGGSNITYINNSLSASTKFNTMTTLSLGKETENMAYTSCTNVTLYNNTLIDTTINTRAILLKHNCSIMAYNTNFNKNKVVQDVDLKSNMTAYYSVAITDGIGVTFNFSDGANKQYGPYQSATYLTSYFRSRFYSKTANISWENYKYNATRSGDWLNGTFTLNKTTTLTFYSVNENDDLQTDTLKGVLFVVFLACVVYLVFNLGGDIVKPENIIMLLVAIICAMILGSFYV